MIFYVWDDLGYPIPSHIQHGAFQVLSLVASGLCTQSPWEYPSPSHMCHRAFQVLSPIAAGLSYHGA